MSASSTAHPETQNQSRNPILTGIRETIKCYQALKSVNPEQGPELLMQHLHKVFEGNSDWKNGGETVVNIYVAYKQWKKLHENQWIDGAPQHLLNTVELVLSAEKSNGSSGYSEDGEIVIVQNPDSELNLNSDSDLNSRVELASSKVFVNQAGDEAGAGEDEEDQMPVPVPMVNVNDHAQNQNYAQGPAPAPVEVADDEGEAIEMPVLEPMIIVNVDPYVQNHHDDEEENESQNSGQSPSSSSGSPQQNTGYSSNESPEDSESQSASDSSSDLELDSELHSEWEPTMSDDQDFDASLDFVPPQPPAGKNHKCPYPNCFKVYNRPGRLADHIRAVHTGERPFSCPICQKTFGQKETLKGHVKTHASRTKSKSKST